MSPLGWLRRTAARHRYATDLALAVLVCAVMLLGAAASGLTVAVVLAAVLTCGPLVLRRRAPFVVLALTTVGTAVYSALTRADAVALAALVIALYSAAETTGQRKALTAGWLVVLTLALTHVRAPANPWAGWENVGLIALVGLAVVAGDAAHRRRKYIGEVEERARRAEHDRDQEARRRVTEERLRIARDLHDVLAHQLALINVQTGVAAHVLTDRPDQARQALAYARHACRCGLDELRDTVGLLRDAGESATPTEPTAGLAGLDELVTSFTRSGMRIDHQVDGVRRRLPPAADLTAYRVIQESLTNVRKHAGEAAAHLRLCYEPLAVRIEVEDDGNGRPVVGAASGGGHGIAGMRERVAAIGGELNAGPRPGSGFRVSASLPLREGYRR